MISIGVVGYFITLGFLLFYMCSCLSCCKKTTVLYLVIGSSPGVKLRGGGGGQTHQVSAALGNHDPIGRC